MGQDLVVEDDALKQHVELVLRKHLDLVRYATAHLRRIILL